MSDGGGSGRAVVPAAWEGRRLDTALAERLGLPRSRIAGWIRSGRVRVDGRPAAKAGLALRTGAELTWDPPPPEPGRVDPEPGELAVLHEDAQLIAVDKPAGLVVHPGAGRSTGTLVHRLLARYPELAGVGGPGRPGIVHRLDRGTSGVLLVARTPESYQRLVRAFSGREVDKRYLAVVRGVVREDRGTVEQPIARHRTERKKMAVSSRGKAAVTDWRVLDRARGATLLELRIRTGRTHQIRVHARHLGHPIVGDEVYGGFRRRRRGDDPLDGFPRPALHAWRLALAHPATGEPFAVEAPVPEDLAALWRTLSGGDAAPWQRP
ncbi:MAG TPA: RluA family pseudouridine synthase [Thermoanaerobaculia bacterium]|nr:RluA family pseudouridine synthase [Thermoanaerobaculia bacterium]